MEQNNWIYDPEKQVLPTEQRPLTKDFGAAFGTAVSLSQNRPDETEAIKAGFMEKLKERGINLAKADVIDITEQKLP